MAIVPCRYPAVQGRRGAPVSPGDPDRRAAVGASCGCGRSSRPSARWRRCSAWSFADACHFHAIYAEAFAGGAAL